LDNRTYFNGSTEVTNNLKGIKMSSKKKSKKNVKTFLQKMAASEGGKVNLPIAQIAEVVRNAEQVRFEDPDYRFILDQYGQRVSKRLAKLTKRGKAKKI
jgi:hypothetical protein